MRSAAEQVERPVLRVRDRDRGRQRREQEEQPGDHQREVRPDEDAAARQRRHHVADPRERVDQHAREDRREDGGYDDNELDVGLDQSSNDSFVMPVKEQLQVYEDPTLHRQQRAGYYGWAELGFGVLDNRRILLGSF